MTMLRTLPRRSQLAGTDGEWMDRLIRQVSGLMPLGRFETDGLAWMPVAELEEKEAEYLLSVELPGVKREDIDLGIDGNVLTLRATREESREEKDRKYFVTERRYGEFERTFTLPLSVSPGEIRADLRDGVLTVHLPKNEEAKGRRIEVVNGS